MFNCRRNVDRQNLMKKKENRKNNTNDFLVRNTEHHPLQNTPQCLRPRILFYSLRSLSRPFSARIFIFFYFVPFVYLSFSSSSLCPLFHLFFPPSPFSFTGIDYLPPSFSIHLSPVPSLSRSLSLCLHSSHESFARLGARVFTNRALFLDVPTTERNRAFSSRVVPPAFLPVAVSFLASCPTFFPSSLRDRSGSTSVSFSLFLSSFFSFPLYSAPFSSWNLTARESSSPRVSRNIHDFATRALSPYSFLCPLYQNNTYAYVVWARSSPDNREYQSVIL